MSDDAAAHAAARDAFACPVLSCAVAAGSECQFGPRRDVVPGKIHARRLRLYLGHPAGRRKHRFSCSRGADSCANCRDELEAAAREILDAPAAPPPGRASRSPRDREAAIDEALDQLDGIVAFLRSSNARVPRQDVAARLDAIAERLRPRPNELGESRACARRLVEDKPERELPGGDGEQLSEHP